jgi:tetratricopeptide (TPR) repeat protein
MSRTRWQHLDRKKPVAQAPPASAPPLPSVPSSPPTEPVDPAEAALPRAPAGPSLRLAAGYYQLRQFQACADAVLRALETEPDLPGAHRLLGLALGRLGQSMEAARALSKAVLEEPNASGLRASFQSAQIEAGVVPDAGDARARDFPEEIAGAAEWLRGQSRLRARNAAGAARHFEQAGALFARSSPEPVLGERLAACYVGQAISLLLAGQLDAAQQCFSRLRRRELVPVTVHAFAQQLYELADAVRDFPSDERAAAIGPLVDLVLAARLRVRFYDGSQPVAMRWENMPSEG